MHGLLGTTGEDSAAQQVVLVTGTAQCDRADVVFLAHSRFRLVLG